MNEQKIDVLKIKLTISAALDALDRLEKSLDTDDQRGVGRELYNTRRELYYLKRLIKGEDRQDGDT